MNKIYAYTTLGMMFCTSMLAVTLWLPKSHVKAQNTGSIPTRVAISSNTQNYKSCLPKQARQVELLGEVTDSQNIYYLLGIYGQKNQFWEELIQVSPSNQCTSLISEANLQDYPSLYVPMPIAQELALQQFTNLIKKAGGKQAFQQSLMEETQNDPDPEAKGYLPPEYEWALNQLGVQIPFEYEVLSPGEAVPQL